MTRNKFIYDSSFYEVSNILYDPKHDLIDYYFNEYFDDIYNLQNFNKIPT